MYEHGKLGISVNTSPIMALVIVETLAELAISQSFVNDSENVLSIIICHKNS